MFLGLALVLGRRLQEACCRERRSFFTDWQQWPLDQNPKILTTKDSFNLTHGILTILKKERGVCVRMKGTLPFDVVIALHIFTCRLHWAWNWLQWFSLSEVVDHCKIKTENELNIKILIVCNNDLFYLSPVWYLSWCYSTQLFCSYHLIFQKFHTWLHRMQPLDVISNICWFIFVLRLHIGIWWPSWFLYREYDLWFLAIHMRCIYLYWKRKFLFACADVRRRDYDGWLQELGYEVSWFSQFHYCMSFSIL